MAKKDPTDLTVEEKLETLYKLQTTLSAIDEKRALRGELPLEVQDLEDEIAGLTTRVEKIKDEIEDFQQAVTQKKAEIAAAQISVKKYNEQLDDVQNNREYDTLKKEIEFQTLEIELCNKKIREAATNVEMLVEPRLLSSFKRIRMIARYGLGIVYVQRDACGGCFNKIPPQRQLDIKMHKKIIVCEYCGRIMIDPELAGVKTVAEEDKPKRKRTIRKRTVVKKEMIGVPEDRLS